MFEIVIWVASAIVVFLSFVMMVTKRPLFLDDKKYTYVSLEKFSRIAGILGMILGISGGICLYYLSKGKVDWLLGISFIILCIGYGAYFYAKKKVLVKKGTKTTKKPKKNY